MLEESHRMLAQVRDALEIERSERVSAGQQLEHEQRRTQLLLDVLKHFKEKLQGLTPQMLMTRLGCSDPKSILASIGAPASEQNGWTTGDAAHQPSYGIGGVGGSGGGGLFSPER